MPVAIFLCHLYKIVFKEVELHYLFFADFIKWTIDNHALSMAF